MRKNHCKTAILERSVAIFWFWLANPSFEAFFGPGFAVFAPRCSPSLKMRSPVRRLRSPAHALRSPVRKLRSPDSARIFASNSKKKRPKNFEAWSLNSEAYFWTPGPSISELRSPVYFGFFGKKTVFKIAFLYQASRKRVQSCGRQFLNFEAQRDFCKFWPFCKVP